MAKAKEQSVATEQAVTIPAPNFKIAEFTIVGTSPYVHHKWDAKAREMMRAAQEAGSTAKTKRKREPKDFQACYEGAKYRTKEGWCGIPAVTIRRGLVSACRIVNYKMTMAKLALFVLEDGYDSECNAGLVKITKGEPHYHEAMCRNQTGVADIRARPMWDSGWEARVRIRYDADLFTVTDVANLLSRVGQQVGIGEGRPDSPESCGLGWGMFEIVSKKAA